MTKAIHTNGEYNEALKRAQVLMDLAPLSDSPEGRELLILAELIQEYIDANSDLRDWRDMLPD